MSVKWYWLIIRWYADECFYKCLLDFLQWLQRTVKWGCAAAGAMLMFLRAAPNDISSFIVFCLCYHCTLLMRCMFYSYSDPYTKLSLYDPASGEITSLQTKTIKKVSLACMLSFFFLFLKLFLTIFFSLFLDTKTLDPKWYEEFFFQVSKS